MSKAAKTKVEIVERERNQKGGCSASNEWGVNVRPDTKPRGQPDIRGRRDIKIENQTKATQT